MAVLKDGVIRRLSPDELLKRYGKCGETVVRKVDFIEKKRSFKVYPGMSSEVLKSRLESHAEELYDLLPEDYRAFLGCDPEMAVNNTGMKFPTIRPSSMTSPLDNKEYKFCLDFLLSEISEGLNTIITSGKWQELLVKFPLSSMTGLVDSEDMNNGINCAAGGAAKRSIVALTKEWRDSGRPLDDYLDTFIIVIKRLQFEKKGKERFAYTLHGSFDDKESEILELDDEIKDLFTMAGISKISLRNLEHAMRVRDASAWNGFFNMDAVMLNRLFMECIAIRPVLAKLFKFTDESVNIDIQNRFLSTWDVVNNDGSFPLELSKYIMSSLFNDSAYKAWDHYDASTIVGGYRDENDEPVYYEIEGHSKIIEFWRGLSSGSGFTSGTNKLGHCPTQIMNHVIACGKQTTAFASFDALREFILDETVFIKNNGDDCLNGFESFEISEKFRVAMEKTNFINYEEELNPKSFSGMYFYVNSNHSARGLFKTPATLLLKSNEMERRDWDSALGRMKHLSILGKIDNFLSFDHDTNATDYVNLFLSIHAPEIDSYSELVLLAQEEEKTLLEGGSSKAVAYARLVRALNIEPSKAHRINWDYTAEELNAADAEAADELFVTFRLVDILGEKQGLQSLVNPRFFKNDDVKVVETEIIPLEEEIITEQI